MRNNSSNRRPRGRNNNNNNNGPRRNNGGGNNRSQVFDSNGPEVRIRGTAHQVSEKYLALAKDATSSGDLVLAESYFQHAEHYLRLINNWNREDEAKKVVHQNVSEESAPQEDKKEHAAAEPEQKKAPRAPRVKRTPKQEVNDDLGLPQTMLTPSPIAEDAPKMQDA